MFGDMRYYNLASSIFVQDCVSGAHTKSTKKRRFKLIWKRPPEVCVIINIDAFGNNTTKSTFIGYVMRDNNARTIMAKGSKLGTA